MIPEEIHRKPCATTKDVVDLRDVFGPGKACADRKHGRRRRPDIPLKEQEYNVGTLLETTGKSIETW